MEFLKNITIETIKKMPDNSSFDDIMYELNFVSKVLEGAKDADEGRVFTNEELLERIDTWVESFGRIERKKI